MQKRPARGRGAMFGMCQSVTIMPARRDVGRKASPDQSKEWTDARKAFDEAQPCGW